MKTAITCKAPAKLAPALNLSEFAEGTSLHGFKHIAGSSGATGKRATWTLLFITTLVFCAILLVITIYKYFLYESLTTVTREMSNPLMFPAVTLCNIQVYKGDTDFLLLSEFLSLSGNSMSTLYTNATFRENMYNEMKNVSMDEFMDRITYPLDDVLVYCEFENDPIECASYFKPLNLLNSGKCFTFNSQEFMDRNGSLMTTSPGPSFGLNLVMDTHRESVQVFGGGFGIGFKVLLHSPSVFPLMDEQAFVVAPGVDTYVSVKKVENYRLPVPYSKMDCRGPGSLIHGMEYSEELCQHSCVIDKLYMDQCVYQERDVRGRQPCNMYHTMVMGLRLYRHYAEMLRGCNCLPMCESVRYEHSVTTAGLSDVKLSFHARRKSWPTRDITYIKDNYVHLKIFYDSFEYVLSVQKPALTFQTIMSEIGGLLGFFLGASVMTVVEIFEYLVFTVYGMVRKKSQRNIVTVKPMEG